MSRKYLILISMIMTALIFTACGKQQVMDGPDMFLTIEYTQISQEEAKEMMTKDDGHIIVDVRTQEEYATGHIPGAICIPNETIESTPPEELPDRSQVILVYCRSGRRSKEAAQKLANLGYTDVYEFGGIIDWTGETEVAKEAMDETESATETEPGATEAEISATEAETPVLAITAGETTFLANLEDNSSAQALVEKLKEGPITVDMTDYGSFEKVGPLPWELPRNDESITTGPGDVILYQGANITIYYDQNTWDFTRLARIPDVSSDELLNAFGDGSVSITFSLE